MTVSDRGEEPATKYRVKLAGFDVGDDELAAIRNVFASGVLTNGNRTREFEDLFATRHAADHAIALANGTVALTAIYLGLGIGPGDEVVVPSLTFVSTATSVVHVGATPIFADIERRTFGLDPTEVEQLITARTKAIVAVHYGGQACEIAELRRIADSAGISLIEDAAEAHGATYRGRPVGTWGRAAMFSFTPTKNITTGEGGVVTTNDSELADRLRLLRNHGQSAPYEHGMLGFNWRMTEMQAAMGTVQLTKLDVILARKRCNAEWMRHRLAGVNGLQVPTVMEDRDHTYMLYTLLVERDRDRIMRELHTAGIEARLYFPPAHLQPIFAGVAVKLPVTEDVAQRMISVPFHSKLELADLEYVAHALEQAVMGADA
jgi:perosamine synthetase